MAMFSVKGSAKWGDSTEEKQLHSSLFDSPVSSKNSRKSTSPDQKQTDQASKKKPRKRKNSKNYDNFTNIKNPKKTEPHPRHLVIPVPVKDATTKDQHDIEDRSQIYPQSRENSPPPSKKKKKKRRRKDSVGSDSGLTGSKGHEKSLKIKRKNRNRLNSQGDEQNVNKTIHKQRKRTTSVSSIGSDSSLGSPKSHSKKSKLKSKNLDNIRTDKGDNKQGGDQSSPRINAQGDKEQDGDGGGEREEEPKRKKRKRKPRNNKFKKSEGNEKPESKESHPAVEQRSKVSELSVSNHLPSEVRTNGSTLVNEENRTKQKRIKKNKVRQKQVANDSKVNRTLPTKDLSSTKTHVNLQSQEVKPSHTKKMYSSELKVQHKEETTFKNVRETADQENGSQRKKKGTEKRRNDIEASHAKQNNSSEINMSHKEEAFSEKAKEILKQQSRARKKRRRKRHSESELENTEVENLPAVKMLNKEEDSPEKYNDTADQGHNSKQKKRAHKRSSKGRKKQAQVAQPKSANKKVKTEKEEILESESEDEGEKVLESVVQSEGLLHRVSRVKNGSKNKEGKKLMPSTADQSDSSDEESDDSPVKNEQSQNLKGQKERKGQSQKSRLESQLRSSHFRFLNEKLYQCSGSEAYEMMTEDKDAFEIYHEGYSQQVEQWPVNPVNVFIKYLKSKPSSVVVGDFGCGEAQIAQSVKQKVHSFDLCAMNKYVTVCDIATVPLDDESLDVAVFCLSLMGTNWIDYIKEANRVLKTGGVLKIAEVASRFQSLAAFIKIMKSLGFNSTSKDLSNKMFSLFDFTKQKQYRNIDVDKGEVLKPCLYKKR